MRRSFLILCALLGAFSLQAQNVVGTVKDTQGNPLEGVMVSDGYEVVYTSKDGTYALQAEKQDPQRSHFYVFISQPSGYECLQDGVFAQFWQPVEVRDNAVQERHDFTLKKVDNDSYVALVLGDFHLCNRNSLGDIKQFKHCMQEINALYENYAKEGRRAYLLTLGDMTWDIYWDATSKLKYCNFDLNAYRKFINEQAAAGFQFWHTMGNHDYDYTKVGDWEAAVAYKSIIGPTYYSFNLGKCHYVVIDNIISTNGGTQKTRGNRKGIVRDQLEWLKRDLERVDKDTPLFLTMHAQVLSERAPQVLSSEISQKNDTMENWKEFMEILKPFSRVELLSGDTHLVQNIRCREYPNIYEHNAGAICETWWWGARLNEGKVNIARDGVPSCYTIYDVNGTQIRSQLKGVDLPLEKQFTAYDRNSICLTAERYCPKAKPEHKKKFEQLTQKAGYNYPTSKKKKDEGFSEYNNVYINVWNWNDRWKVEVEENGRTTEAERVFAYDPMHIISYSAKCFNMGKNTTGSFVTRPVCHMFRYKAMKPNSTLTIRVTDEYGQVYTEQMQRPKPFEIAW